MEEMKEKRREAEDLMSYMFLPKELKERVRRYKQYKWETTRGVELDHFVKDLPRDLRRDIRRHLCLPSLKRVPLFEAMDGHLLDAMCDRLKVVLYTEGSYISREGDPAQEMLFITGGRLESVTTNGGRTNFLNVFILVAGNFCGEELLTWALDPKSPQLPFSTRTVRALTDVQAFALVADELSFVVSQFRLFHDKRLQHIFRFYAQQWRTWAACFIQAAWRRHWQRMLRKILEADNSLQGILATGNEASTLSLGTSVYVSKFSSNALRILRQNHNAQVSTQHVMPQSLPLDDEPHIEIKIE